MPFEVQKNVSLAPFTTIKVGGPAKYFIQVRGEEELVEACNWAKKKAQKLFILGGGSNIVVSDDGFNGLVILFDMRGREYRVDENRHGIFAVVMAGESWDDFVADVVSKGYSGLECLSGVPGKVGGAAVQNIGAYGQEIRETVINVRFYDIDRDDFAEYTNEECQFVYRGSVFKGKSEKIITSVQFLLKKDATPVIKYKELKEKLGGTQPTVEQVRLEVLALRKSKSMLLDPGDPNSINNGSFFKNPIVPEKVSVKLKEAFPNLPNWPQQDGSVKLSAGWLIENSGLPRGYIYGSGKVGLSQKHALAIINRGGARSKDVLDLSGLIQTNVLKTFGVKLELEVVLVSFD